MIIEKVKIKNYPYCDGCAGVGCEKMCYYKEEKNVEYNKNLSNC